MQFNFSLLVFSKINANVNTEYDVNPQSKYHITECKHETELLKNKDNDRNQTMWTTIQMWSETRL